MSYRYRNDQNGYIWIDPGKGNPDSILVSNAAGSVSTRLPSDPAQVQAFIEAVLDATNCELITTDVNLGSGPAEWGADTWVAKRGQ